MISGLVLKVHSLISAKLGDFHVKYHKLELKSPYPIRPISIFGIRDNKKKERKKEAIFYFPLYLKTVCLTLKIIASMHAPKHFTFK